MGLYVTVYQVDTLSRKNAAARLPAGNMRYAGKAGKVGWADLAGHGHQVLALHELVVDGDGVKCHQGRFDHEEGQDAFSVGFRVE